MGGPLKACTHSFTQHNTAEHSTAQHITTQHNTTQHSTTHHNTTQHNTTQHSTTQNNTRRSNCFATPTSPTAAAHLPPKTQTDNTDRQHRQTTQVGRQAGVAATHQRGQTGPMIVAGAHLGVQVVEGNTGGRLREMGRWVRVQSAIQMCTGTGTSTSTDADSDSGTCTDAGTQAQAHKHRHKQRHTRTSSGTSKTCKEVGGVGAPRFRARRACACGE